MEDTAEPAAGGMVRHERAEAFRLIDAHVISTRKVGNHLEYCIEAASLHPDYSDQPPWTAWRRFKDFAATDRALRSRRNRHHQEPMPALPPKTLSRHASGSKIGEARAAQRKAAELAAKRQEIACRVQQARAAQNSQQGKAARTDVDRIT